MCRYDAAETPIANPLAAGGGALTIENSFPSGALQYRKHRTRSSVDTAQLALALVMVAVLAGLIYVSELDNVYWTNMRITAFVQRALGIRRPVDDGSAARALRGGLGFSFHRAQPRLFHRRDPGHDHR